jgi:hypothetical protein
VVTADFATLGQVVAHVAGDRALRERLSTAGRRAIDGRGAERVADEIARLLAARRARPVGAAR